MEQAIDMADMNQMLEFETYQDYLDSFVNKTDLCYMRSSFYARRIAELGYRYVTTENQIVYSLFHSNFDV